ncbi:hypothetical protein FACS1894152_4670 [Bacilli bacterium]|nr:hypothetical protein FACS1894152_4670 [Bacilli bacterium]
MKVVNARTSNYTNDPSGQILFCKYIFSCTKNNACFYNKYCYSLARKFLKKQEEV